MKLFFLIFTMVLSLCGQSQSRYNYSKDQYFQERINILKTIINYRTFDSINSLYNDKKIPFGTDEILIDSILCQLQKNNSRIKIYNQNSLKYGYWIYDDITIWLSKNNTEYAALQLEYTFNKEGITLLGITLEKKNDQWEIIDLSIIE